MAKKKSWRGMADTGRWVDDMISGMSGRSGQEAKRRRAGRIRKEDMDIDRFIRELDREASFKYVYPPRRARRKLPKKKK